VTRAKQAQEDNGVFQDFQIQKCPYSQLKGLIGYR
jgi:hypothetical protein